jgi:hypothetical protein
LPLIVPPVEKLVPIQLVELGELQVRVAESPVYTPAGPKKEMFGSSGRNMYGVGDTLEPSNVE